MQCSHKRRATRGMLNPLPICDLTSAVNVSSRVIPVRVLLCYRNDKSIQADRWAGRQATHAIKRPANTCMKRPAASPDYSDFNNAVLVKRPSGAILAHAWTRGGSHHRPAKGKALGYHPPEFKSKWSTKKGIGTLIARACVIHVCSISSDAPPRSNVHSPVSTSPISVLNVSITID